MCFLKDDYVCSEYHNPDKKTDMLPICLTFG